MNKLLKNVHPVKATALLNSLRRKKETYIKIKILWQSSCSENQQFLKEIVRSVLKGDGVGWLVSKKLRKLMTDEALRAMVASRLYSAPSADMNTDAVDDMVCYNYHYLVNRVIDYWLKISIIHSYKVNAVTMDAVLAQLYSNQTFICPFQTGVKTFFLSLSLVE